MNDWQAFRQLQYLLRTACTWPNGTSKVFDRDSVKILEQGQEGIALDENLIPPIAIFAPTTGQIDPRGRGEQPDLIERYVDLTLVVVNQGDRVGEGAIVGAQRYGANDSRGRGVLEIFTPVLAAIQRLTSQNGVVIALNGYGASATKRAGDYWVAIQDYQFVLYCTASKFYPPPAKLQAAPSTGQVLLTWRNPADRWDRYRVRLVRKSGSTPPTSVTDGTEITLPGALPTLYIDSGLAAGTYSYSLFASYSEFDVENQDDATSDPVTVSGVVSF